MEPDRYPGHHVRQSPALRRSAQTFRRRNRFQHSGRQACASAQKGTSVAYQQSVPQAKSHLQPDRGFHPVSASSGAHGRVGTKAHTRLEGTISPRTALGRGRRTHVESIYGRTEEHSSRSATPSKISVRRTSSCLRSRCQSEILRKRNNASQDLRLEKICDPQRFSTRNRFAPRKSFPAFLYGPDIPIRNYPTSPGTAAP
jgi:hypothetical protein